jgi:hypothetical protein
MKQLTAARIGMISAAVMIILSLVFFYVLKQPVESEYQYIIFGIDAIGVIIALALFSLRSNTVVFKDYFSEGFKTFIIITFFIVIYILIFNICNPQIREAKLALNSHIAAQDPNRTPEEVAENTAALRPHMLALTVAGYTVLYLALGAIITTLTSAVIIQLKKK